MAALAIPFLPYRLRSIVSGHDAGLILQQYRGPYFGFLFFVSLAAGFWFMRRHRLYDPRFSRDAFARVDLLFSFLLLFPLGFHAISTDTSLQPDGAVVAFVHGYGDPSYSALMFIAAVIASVALQQLLAFHKNGPRHA